MVDFPTAPPSWDSYLLAMAKAAASKSRDPSTQVGCILADISHRVLAAGFNGLPRGVTDHLDRLIDRDIKLKITLHAEENALLFAQRDLTGATAYVYPMPPCVHCSALLIQAGIARIVAPQPSLELQYRWGESLDMGAKILREAGVILDLVADGHE